MLIGRFSRRPSLGAFAFTNRRATEGPQPPPLKRLDAANAGERRR